MNTPLSQPSQQANVLQSSRRRVHTHVVTLERVQQSSVLPHQFNVQEVTKQQHPRFYRHDLGLIPLYHLQADLEGMRGLLQSCWETGAGQAVGQAPTTTTTAPPAPSPHRAQWQRLRRVAAAHLDHVSGHAAPAAPSGPEQQGRRRGRSNSSAESAPPDSSAGSGAAAAADAFAVGDQQTYLLRVLMDLWHLHSNHDGLKANASMGYNIPLPQAPRMLTAEEERVLATIIQHNRKLQQLCSQHPDTAAAFVSTTSTTSSSSGSSATSSTTTSSSAASSSATSSSVGSSSSVSYKQPQYKDKRHRWPPPLSPADVSELSALPAVWRAMLPALAAQAEELLVAFNTGLVLFMLRRIKRVADVPEGDLVASGLAGLRLAAGRFDPGKGTRFSTVASMWIAQHITRSSVAEAGRAMRRPEHHLQMVRHVVQHYGSDTLLDIERRPDVVKQVAVHFKARPAAVIAAIRDTITQHSPTSLEAIASSSSSKADYSSTAWANLLTTTDLDEDAEVLGGSGQEGSMSGGVGTLLAAAGQIPAWAQASMRLPQQQQGTGALSPSAPAAAAAAAAAAGEGAAATSELVAAAAAKLVQLAAETASPVASVTGTMLDTVDDAGGVLELSMQSMLQVLTPLEQQVITVLYGLDQDATAGLGVELPPSALGSVSSSTAVADGGSSGSGSRGRRSSSRSSADSGVDGVRAALSGRNPKVLQAAKGNRGMVTLKQAAVQLGFGSHQLVANVRNQALGKLAAATRQAAAAAAGAGGQLPTAAGEAGSSSGDEEPGAAAAAATAAAAVVAPPTYTGARTVELIELMRQYVEEHGHLPLFYGESYKGVSLYSWMQRVRARYWKGKVAPVVVATLEQAVPFWDWGTPGGDRAAGDGSSNAATAAAASRGAAAAAAASRGAAAAAARIQLADAAARSQLAAAASRQRPSDSRRRSNAELVQLLQQYVQEHGHLPQARSVRYKGSFLYVWMQRVRARYWKGKVAPVVVAMLEEAVPIWDWGTPGRDEAAPAAAAAAATAASSTEPAAPASEPSSGSSSSRRSSSSSRRSSRRSRSSSSSPRQALKQKG